MAEYEMKFHLIQQTPIIQFQYDQDGATLRASEVKPKLDKFVVKICGGSDKVHREHSDWFLKDTDALCYKLRFSCEKRKFIDLGYKTDYDIYYGDMGAREKVKGVMADNDGPIVEMTIICMNKSLREALREHISTFFIVTNFGRMQNKGFGSFIIDKCNCGETAIVNALCKEYSAKACYILNGGDKPFVRIKTVYGIIKSGINLRHRGLYRRSLLFIYMHNKLGIGNEKAYLKQHGLVPVVPDGDQKWHRYPSQHKPRYVRALLGTGDHLDFIKDPQNPGNKISVKISNETILRFPSTLFFKVINGTIYYVGKRIDSVIFGKMFAFESTYRTGSKEREAICVPEKTDEINENFMDDFLSYCCKELNNRNPENHGTAMTAFPNMYGVDIREVKYHG